MRQNGEYDLWLRRSFRPRNVRRLPAGVDTRSSCCGWKRLRIVARVLAVAVLFAQGGFAAADETQQWSELKFVAKASSHIDIFAATTLRLAEVEPTVNRVSGQLGLNLHAAKWLTLSPNYQYIVNEPTEETSSWEHRPGIVTAFGFPIGSAQATLSTSFEYRVREGRGDSWRLRPKLKLKHALGPKNWKLDGYLANELFFDSTEDDVVRDRFFAGLEKKLGDHWTGDLYYCRQHDIRSSTPDLNIIGVSMTLHFDARGAAWTASK